MEQVFVIIAVVIFWIFKGVAGTQRQVPGQDPHDSEPLGGPIDISGAARQKTLESQQRAMEALQRWEAKQGLSGGKGDPARAASAEAVPAAARTRVGRPATTRSRSAARQRKEAFAEIAGMLDPAQASSATPARRPSFEVSTPASSPPDREAPRPGADRRPSDAATRRDTAHKDEEARREIAAEQSSAATKARKERVAKASGLARLESLPLEARAIVYAEILGPPRSFS